MSKPTPGHQAPAANAQPSHALITQPNFSAADDFYEALIDAHRDLATPQSHNFNAKLLLLLANHIGRQDVLLQAIAAARDSALRAHSEVA